MYIGSVVLSAVKPLVPKPSLFKDEIAIANLKEYKMSGIGQIAAEIIEAKSGIIPSEIHKFTNSVWNGKNCLSSGRSLLLHQFINIKENHCCQIHKKCIQYPSLKIKSMH
jgi:hypothetical protein